MIYLNNDVFTPCPGSHSLCRLKASTGPPSSMGKCPYDGEEMDEKEK